MGYLDRLAAATLVSLCVSTIVLGDATDGLLQHFGMLGNVAVEYHRTTKYDPDPDLLSGMPADQRAGYTQPVARTERSRESIRFVDRRLLYQSEADPGDLEQAAKGGVINVAKQVLIVGPERCEEMVALYRSKRPAGAIQDEVEIPLTCFVDVALGRRIMNSQVFLKAEDLKGMHREEQADGDVLVRWTDAEKAEHVMRFAKEFGYALRGYRKTYPAKDTFEEITCSDFRRVADGVYVPYAIRKIISYPDSKGKIRQPIVSDISVDRVQLDVNGTEDFMIRWPKGSSVRDRRTNLVVSVRDDDELLTDRRLFEYLKEREEAERVDTTAAQGRIRRAATQPVDAQ